jgi:hypothetical protein
MATKPADAGRPTVAEASETDQSTAKAGRREADPAATKRPPVLGGVGWSATGLTRADSRRRGLTMPKAPAATPAAASPAQQGATASPATAAPAQPAVPPRSGDPAPAAAAAQPTKNPAPPSAKPTGDTAAHAPKTEPAIVSAAAPKQPEPNRDHTTEAGKAGTKPMPTTSAQLTSPARPATPPAEFGGAKSGAGSAPAAQSERGSAPTPAPTPAPVPAPPPVPGPPRPGPPPPRPPVPSPTRPTTPAGAPAPARPAAPHEAPRKDQQTTGGQQARAEQPATRPQSAAVLQASRGDKPIVGSQPSGDHTAGPAKIAEPGTAESPKPETHIAEQRVSGDHLAAQEAPAKPPAPAAAEKPAKPMSRLSNYQAEAAKLLAGAMTGRRKRRAVPEVPVADPVAEDQAGQASRPAKKGQFKKD